MRPLKGQIMEHHHRSRILIADDHILVAQACKSFLEPEFEVVGTANDGRALLQAAAQLRPDVVILDIAMPGLNGLDAGEQLKHMMRNVKIVYLSFHAEPDVCAEAFRRGASGYVLKQSASEELVRAVRAVLRNGSYITPLIVKDTVDFLLRSGDTSTPEKRITRRQREILQLLAEGKSMKEVASILSIRTGTVAFHKYKTMESLGLRTNAELLRYAIEHHLVE
ncbi:MAG: response regulator transcription factor [Terriglobia bacterium]|nr:response regulator transcription factor [Terriglobia bacterium]